MLDLFSMTLQNLRRRGLRTLLTVAGIAVGTVLITVVSCLGDTGKAIFGAELKSMGLDGISVSAATDNALDEETLKAIRSLGTVAAAMPLTVQFSAADVGTFEGDIMACGIDAGADQVISLTERYGRLLSRGDVAGVRRVCVIDESLAEAAYGRDNAVGKTLYLRTESGETAFEIVGVSKAGSSVLQNITGYMPSMVYFPYTTLRDLTGVTAFDQIAVRAKDAETLDDTKAKITAALKRQDRVGAAYTVQDLAAQRDRLSGLMDIIRLVLQVISAISLLVAGISIMTIMLASVKERTVEIGIKKAIGATPQRIMTEFLTESVTLALIGSAVGAAFAFAFCLVGGALFGVTVTLSFWTVGGVMGFAVLLGALFGVYPARMAAALPPVRALSEQ